MGAQGAAAPVETGTRGYQGRERPDGNTARAAAQALRLKHIAETRQLLDELRVRADFYRYMAMELYETWRPCERRTVGQRVRWELVLSVRRRFFEQPRPVPHAQQSWHPERPFREATAP